MTRAFRPFYKMFHLPLGAIVMTLLLAIGLASCSSPSLSDKVPAKADLVVKVDLGSVAFKAISWQDLWQTMTSGADTTKSNRPSIANSGLDFTGDYLVYRLPKSGNTPVRYCVLAPLEDEEAFKNFLLGQPEFKAAKQRNLEGVDLLDLPEGVVVGLQDDFAAFVMPEKSDRAQDLSSEVIAAIKTTKQDSWAEQNDQFADLMDDGNDMALFMREGGSPTKPDFQLASHLSFEKGKVVFDAEITGEETLKQTKQLEGKQLSADFMEGIKLANPNVLAAIAFNTDSLSTLLKSNQNDAVGSADQTLNGFETSMADLVAMWDGQLGFAGNISPEMILTSSAAIKMGVKDQKRVEDWLLRLKQKGVVKQLDQNKFITALFGLELELLPGQMTMSMNRTDGQDDNKLTEIQTKTLSNHHFGVWISPELLQASVIALSDSAPKETRDLMQDVYLTADITPEAGIVVDGVVTFKQTERQSAQLLLLYARHARIRGNEPAQDPDDMPAPDPADSPALVEDALKEADKEVSGISKKAGINN